MICISVTPESRTLAPADLLNASRNGDLIELCLDHFLKEPNVGELIRMVDKPILVSCRRPRDGGHWDGTEEERIQLLRTAIVAGPAYVELDLDIAGSIPRFGNTKRVISYCSLNRPLGNIDEIFEQCWKAKADVVKVTWPTDDLDAAWPLLAAVTQAREVPVVGLGIGRSGLTFSLLGRRYGSPWLYAALEKGMEAFEQQPTVFQLKEDYRWDEINNKTRFLGIVGFGAAENTAARILNKAFSIMEKPIRCLPLIPGEMTRLAKMLSVLKINGLIVDPSYSADMSQLAMPADDLVQRSGYMDVLMQKSDGWKGIATLMQAVDLTGQQSGCHADWSGRGQVIICGHGPAAKAAAVYFSSKGSPVSLSSPSDNSATITARTVGVRQIPWNGIHDVRADTLILADHGLHCGHQRGELNPSIIREKMTVVDLTAYPRNSSFAEESVTRGARLVSPESVFITQLKLQFQLLTGRELPEASLGAGLGI